MKTSNVGRLAPVCLFFLMTFAAQAQWFDQGPVFVVTEENDSPADTDRHYTQGFKMSYLCTDNHAPDWLKNSADAIPTWGFSQEAIKIGTQLGQNIYTPSDKRATAVVPDDRPYAGWLYTGFILQRRGLTAGKRPALESFQMDIGVVGCPSLAEQIQDGVHSDIEPQGWSHQLDTEPGLALKYMRAWVFSPQREGPRTFDFIPHAGFSLGNIDTSLRAGGIVRWGKNLPDDFGVQTINSLATTEGGLSPKRQGRWGFYVFGGGEGSAVAYNEFLNGNVFHDSHDVTPEPLVGEAKAGIGLVSERVEIGVTWLWRTKDFTDQKETDMYGSIACKVKL
jgi:hypothetical protein